MRIHWKTKKSWCWLDISVWWKSCRFGFWYDKWCDVSETHIYFLCWDIEFRVDRVARWLEKQLEKNK